jgi:hypothetical protein
MKYICLKLNTGDEIIGETDSEHNDEYINIENPVKITHATDSRGNHGISFISFMSYCENSVFTFKQKDVILYLVPTDSMIEYYKDYMSRRAEQLDADEVDAAEAVIINSPSLSIH